MHYNPSALLLKHKVCGGQMFSSSFPNDLEVRQMQKCCAKKLHVEKERGEAKPSAEKYVRDKSTIYQLFKTLSKSIGEQNNEAVYSVYLFFYTPTKCYDKIFLRSFLLHLFFTFFFGANKKPACKNRCRCR